MSLYTELVSFFIARYLFNSLDFILDIEFIGCITMFTEMYFYVKQCFCCVTSVLFFRKLYVFVHIWISLMTYQSK